MNHIKEKVMEGVFLFTAVISIIAVALICVFLFANGFPAMQKIGVWQFLSGKVWKPTNNIFGIFPMILGSIYVTGGALLIGVSRVAAAEFTFFLAVPVMFGWSLIKLIKFGIAFSAQELCVLGLGCVVAFAVSVVVIRFLMGYIKKHDFKVFGWYRIILGAIVLGYFAL